MASSLAHQRCFNHAQREAVARCPECGRFFCRECVTEHEDRVVCASCLTKLAVGAGNDRKRLVVVFRVLECGASLALLWLMFYLLGQGLLALPSSFHEGTLWQTGLWGS
jgi:uncharacterized paraquat-inducible protein A